MIRETYFVVRLTEVITANEWSEYIPLLHLWEALKVDGQNCGWAHMLQRVFEALRTRYKIFPKREMKN